MLPNGPCRSDFRVRSYCQRTGRSVRKRRSPPADVHPRNGGSYGTYLRLHRAGGKRRVARLFAWSLLAEHFDALREWDVLKPAIIWEEQAWEVLHQGTEIRLNLHFWVDLDPGRETGPPQKMLVL